MADSDIDHEQNTTLNTDELEQICQYAERARSGEVRAEVDDLAFALLAVAVSYKRALAGDPPHAGPGLDAWYDKIGQNERVRWVALGDFAGQLRSRGILK